MTLRQHIEEGASALRNAAITRLGQLTTPEQIETLKFNQGACEIELDNLARATLYDETELKDYRRRINDYIRRYQQRGRYEHTKEVEEAVGDG